MIRLYGTKYRRIKYLTPLYTRWTARRPAETHSLKVLSSVTYLHTWHDPRRHPKNFCIIHMLTLQKFSRCFLGMNLHNLQLVSIEVFTHRQFIALKLVAMCLVVFIKCSVVFARTVYTRDTTGDDSTRYVANTMRHLKTSFASMT